MSKKALQKEISWDKDADCIHFLNTGSSDAILIQSQGHFAMIDCAEDSEYPADKPHLNLKGYEEAVIAYLRAHAKNEEGVIQLDFILGTHAHSDHIGGFDTLINCEDVRITKAYVKAYREHNINHYERTKWDNMEVYNQMIEALVAKKIPYTDQFPEAIQFGRFALTFFNTHYDNGKKVIGENDNSLVLKLTKGKKTALLTGDLNNHSGDEKSVANLVGRIDLLKLGHHGYLGSTSLGFVTKLAPKIAIANNSKKNIYPNVRFNLAINHVKVFATVDENGIIATFGKDGTITLTNDSM